MAYDRVTDSIGEVITVMDFYNAVKAGAFIDYDGFGYPAQDPKCFPWKFQGGVIMVDESIRIIPSKLNLIPDTATHIVWYNR